MDILQVIILSIVEGITEFLPISSTGHLILTSEILKIPHNDFLKSFEIIIQLGAILAVVALYFKKLLTTISFWPKLFVAFLPTGVIGLFLYKVVKGLLLGNVLITVLALFLGGVIIILIEKFYREKEHAIKEVEDLTYKKAFLIGLIQSISIIPGVSRSGATIIGGLLSGLNRKTAVEFSFLLAIPTMFAATGYDLIKNYRLLRFEDFSLILIGLVGSFITALLAVKFFLKFVQSNTLIPFGIYRIIISILFFFLFVY